MAQYTWHSIESARSDWLDAPDEDDQLQELLDLSRDAVEAFGGYVAHDIPAGWRAAQLMQARNVWIASTVDSNGSIGEGDFALSPRPLDWMVKQLIRPQSGKVWIL
ncbi:hypothetical protein C5C41_06740 [Rathayibacter sp. AY1E9]|uniref:hypothetical protein n=1 Tax=Rathayibacter sp. AY1E9 TaxID=2080556 RepID=UPI000CE78686|nr:hypothetical protein [Rathayibacter sp. AY1E9]PPG53416.1 hypothetical protein C5C41_06740 [Rathayibacter sp. AY1E9]